MSKPTVVIVDDDRSFVEALAIFLERRGYHGIGAFNGQDGLTRLRKHGVDLGIVDVHLPDISGLDLAKELREAADGPPIILISSDHRPDLSEACDTAGARLFLPKPISPSELLHAISSILHR